MVVSLQLIYRVAPKQLLESGLNVGRQQSLLHDYLEDETSLVPAFEGDVGTVGMHDIYSLAGVLFVQGVGKRGVE